jgi:hypothetical protein
MSGQRRFTALLERRTRIADERGFSQDEVNRDVMAAARGVRKTRASRHGS